MTTRIEIPMEMTRADIADLYRSINTEYRPYADGDLAMWQSLTQDQIGSMCARAELAYAADSSWRRQLGFSGCVYGDKGCPPWGLTFCAGHAQQTGKVVGHQPSLENAVGANVVRVTV